VCALALVACATETARTASRRVISIVPSTTEMLFAMGAGDRLIAVGSYDRYPPEVSRLPRVGALIDPNVEQILAMRPDLVVMYGTQDELRKQLDRAHVPYFAYSHHGLSDVMTTIRALGLRVGVEASANALAGRLEQDITAVRARTANRRRPRTLLVFGREPGSLKNIEASGGEGFLHDMLEAAGGDDVLGDLHRQSVAMSTEMVLARAPEVIIEIRYAEGDRRADADIRAWNALSSVPAVRNGRVYLLKGEEFVVPGPRVANAIGRLARTLHPDAFN
jgi:iron complex transport system substrate-binding protein